MDESLERRSGGVLYNRGGYPIGLPVLHAHYGGLPDRATTLHLGSLSLGHVLPFSAHVSLIDFDGSGEN